MATVTATELSLDSSLEQFKEQFNTLRNDVSLVTLSSLGFADGVVFEGSTTDENETTLVAADPSADRTITLPNATGTVSLLTATETLTNKTLTTPTLTTPIANAGIQLKNGATSAGFLEFFEDSDNGTNKVTLIGPASTSDVTITLPSSGGTVALSGANITVGDGGTVGSTTTTNAMTIASDGIVTFVDDIKIKDGGTIGVASAATAMTIASTGIVSFVDDITIKDGGTIGSASGPTAITIDASGNVTFAANLTVNGSTVTNSATNTVIEDQLIELGNGRTGSASGDAGIVIERGDDANVFIGYDESADRILFGTGSFTGASTGNLSVTTAGVTSASLIIDDGGAIGSASDTDAIEIASAGNVTFTQQPDIAGDFIVQDTAADTGDNLLLDGTDGAGANANSKLLYEFGTSFTNSQLLIKDSNGAVVRAIYGVGGDGAV